MDVSDIKQKIYNKTKNTKDVGSGNLIWTTGTSKNVNVELVNTIVFVKRRVKIIYGFTPYIIIIFDK